MIEHASNTEAVEQYAVMRFRAIADADPSALICILQHLRRGGIAPKTVWSQRCAGGFIEIKIELDDRSDEAFQELVAQVNEMPMIVAAVPFDADWTHTAARA